MGKRSILLQLPVQMKPVYMKNILLMISIKIMSLEISSGGFVTYDDPVPLSSFDKKIW